MMGDVIITRGVGGYVVEDLTRTVFVFATLDEVLAHIRKFYKGHGDAQREG
jgi:hypothetical protein